MSDSANDSAAEEGALAHAVLSALSSGILIVDSTQSVLYANPRTARLFQRSVEELSSMKISSFLAPLDSLLAIQRKVGAEERCEISARRTDGSTILIGFTLSRLNPDREPAQYACVLQDISGYVALRRERDALLRRAIVAELLPSILHELRNPLASITTAVELLLEEVSDEAVQRDLKSVFKEIRRMDLGLQGFAVAGRDLRSRQTIDAAEAVKEAVRVLEPVASEAQVDLQTDAPAMQALSLNPDMLRGLVFNLVRASISGCRAGCKILVRARLLDDRTTFELSVVDNGTSPPAQLTDRSPNMRMGGRAGTALRLSKSAAEAAGGEFFVDAVEGGGTRVTMRIPQARGNERTGPDLHTAR
jgi:nitrogen-specific signal transduction histidine kinase